MTNCIFYTLFFVLFLNLSFGSLRISQVNRAFLSTYKGLYESCTITVGEDGEPIYPYFNQKLLTEYVTNFIDENVGKFVTSYDLSIKFYTLDGITECEEDDLARNTKVRITADINYLFHYNKEQSFTVEERIAQ